MLQRVIRFLRNYFGVSRREANGFVVLMVLILLVMLAGGIVPFVSWSDTDSDREGPPAEVLDSLLASIQYGQESFRPVAALSAPDGPLTPFDPNLADEQTWIRAGAPEWLAQRIQRYIAKGGVSRKKDDVKKIYGFPDALFAQIEPYLLLNPADAPQNSLPAQNTETSERLPNSTMAGQRQALIRLNSADTTALKVIRGIGPKLSARIVSFRDKLGGFYAAEQVREVYGLPPEVADELLKRAELDSIPLRKIRINHVTTEELAAHPYISWPLAKVLIAYRTQHGAFANVESLIQIKETDPQAIRKASPYFSFE